MVRPGCGGGRNLGDSGRGAVRPTWTRDRPHAFPFRAVLTVRLAFASRARIAPPNTERERTDRTNERTGERFCNVIETKRAQFYQLARLVAHTRKPSPASWTPGRLPTGRVAGPSPSGSLSPPSWLAERFGVDGDDPRDAPRVQPRADHPGRRPGNRLERERHAGGRIRPPPPRHGPRMDGRDPGLRDPWTEEGLERAECVVARSRRNAAYARGFTAPLFGQPKVRVMVVSDARRRVEER